MNNNPCSHLIDSTTCFLCDDLSDRGGLISTTGGLSLCSDGAPLTDRHLLLFPNAHHLSFRAFLGNPERSLNVNELLANIVNRDFQSYVFFEHGTGVEARSKGCVEHAHIHILRLENSEQFSRDRFLAVVNEFFAVESVHETEGFDSPHYLLGEDQEYLWLRNGEGNDVVIVGHGRGQRQVARRLLCATLGRPFRPFRGVEEFARSLTIREVEEPTLLTVSDAASIFLIEGLSASGKSTVANLLAERIAAMHIPSGLFYCAAAIALDKIGLSERGAPEEEQLQFLRRCELKPLDEIVASEDVRLLASRIFQSGKLWLAINERIVAHVARFTAMGVPCVVDGRGLYGQWGKRAAEFYLSPRTVERKKRFVSRLGLKQLDGLFVQTERDRLDSERSVGRLQPGPNSLVLDTSNKNPQQVVSEILGHEQRCPGSVHR